MNPVIVFPNVALLSHASLFDVTYEGVTLVHMALFNHTGGLGVSHAHVMLVEVP
jgi:hypothetical protein